MAVFHSGAREILGRLDFYDFDAAGADGVVVA